MEHRHEKPLKTPLNFCYENVNDSIFKNLEDAKRKIIKTAIESYDNRFINGYKYDSPTLLYDDSCMEFINYTFMVATALKNFVNAMGSTRLCTPVQVDLVIIPAKTVRKKEEFEDDFEDDDTDDSEDDSKIFDVSDSDLNLTADIAKSHSSARLLSETFKKVMKGKYSQPYSEEKKEEVHGDYVRRLTDLIDKYAGGRNLRRISVLVDRRTTPNNIFVYTLPADNARDNNASVIPVNYCTTTLIYLSSRFVVPIWDSKMIHAEKFPFVGGSHSFGSYFQVSFQMMDQERTRLQWNFAVECVFYVYCLYVCFL